MPRQTPGGSYSRPQHRPPESRHDFLVGFAGCAVTLALPLAVRADPLSEKFVEDEICIERNLNGSCKKSGIGERKALEEVVDASKKTPRQEDPDNELIAKLKKRTLENKARNDEEIATKTFVNGQSGEFGPFSRYVPVKHKDTGRYELMLVRELDEMKRKGVIVTERGQEVFTDAQEAK
ncbi:unnamed protein product [Ascophyllum nodosum]